MALGLTLAALGAGWVAGAAPLLAWHAERAEALSQRRAVLRRTEQAVAELPRLRQQTTGEAASPAPQALLDGASDALAGAELQGQLEAAATKAGAVLASAELLPAEPSGSYRRISLRLVLTGSWPAVVHLLEAIDQASPRMLVDDIQLQAATSVTAGTAQPVGAVFTVIAFRSGTGG